VDLRPRSLDDRLVDRLASALRVRPATARCLVARGVAEPGDAKGFIDPRLAALRPPAGLAGFARAVSRIADGIDRGERIGVFGDYDVDGITTAALLTCFLRDAGAAIDVAVAQRDAGYGFTVAAVADFALRGCRLVVTGDCGTNDHEAIAAAAARGIDVIVVDHHAVPPADAPHPALALVNPYRADSTFPFRGMASVGLAFYVAAAVRTELRERGYFRSRCEPDVRDLLDLVALGTIADLVPLTGENRILTSLGLRRLQARARPGIAALLEVAGVGGDREIDARTISWKLAPRINAPGRLGAAEPSLSLLLAERDTAPARARVLEEANVQRRALQERVMAEALERVGDDPGPAIVLAGEGWPAGIVGIVAAKLVDRYQRPAFVVAIDPESGIGRGSARTSGNVDLYRALDEAARTHNCLEKFGGHAAAAGFTVTRASVAALTEALGGACARLAAGSGPIPTQRLFDAEVGLVEVDERLAQELAGLGPFGQANPPPVLVTRNARVTALRRVGDGSHVKLTVEDDRSATRSAIGFGLGERLSALGVDVGARLDLAFLPTVSTWQGRRSAELELADVVPTS
jgi:single-stranded-DNA-specific exonuclease